MKARCPGRRFEPAPIGFYFAKLWYWERLYPLVWTVSALGLANRALRPDVAAPGWPAGEGDVTVRRPTAGRA